MTALQPLGAHKSEAINFLNPYEFKEFYWPHIDFFPKQKEIIESVDNNDETIVSAGNMLGKDFVAGFIALRFFMLYGNTEGGCRIITTSVKDDHLRVLWGEIGRYLQTSRVPLLRKHGGRLILNHRDLRIVNDQGLTNPVSYLRGMVSELGEGMAGHHAAHTLAILDESSGIDDLVYDQVRTWAKRILAIGNPLPCANFFYKAVKLGNIKVGQSVTQLENDLGDGE